MLHHYDRDFCVHSELMVGVADCLDALRDRGLPMAVCTNKDQVIARKIVTALGIEPYVKVTVGRQPDITKKPDPAMLNLAAQEIGCVVSSIVMVGDSDVDAATARASGAHSVIVRNGYFLEITETIGADFLIEDMTGFMPLMSETGQRLMLRNAGYRPHRRHTFRLHRGCCRHSELQPVTLRKRDAPRRVRPCHQVWWSKSRRHLISDIGWSASHIMADITVQRSSGLPMTRK